jgi:hypothetical protein
MTAHASRNKTYQPVIAEIRAQGWDLTMTATGRWKAVPPDGRPLVHFSESPDPHALLNTIRTLRDSGLEWPPPSRRTRRPPDDPVSGIVSIIRSTPFPPVKMDVPEAIAVPESPADTMFRQLKEARAYVDLATSELAECETRLAEVRARYNAAASERQKAVEELRMIKDAFDKAFEAT